MKEKPTVKRIKEFYAEQVRKDKLRDTKNKKVGAKYKLTFWVHPQSGDDYENFAYLRAKPTKSQIKKYIKSKGSVVLTDYWLIKL